MASPRALALLLAAPALALPHDLVNPCLNASLPFAKMPWCDHTLPLDVRVKDMISRMSLEEKIGSMGSNGKAIPSLGLPPYGWWNEGTHGVGTMRRTPPTPYATSFALPITTAMSFNRSLWHSTGAQIGREARAIMNAGNAYSTFWAPVVNLARDPRWGRNVETPGEDPYLSGEYAVSFVKGMQESPEDPTHLQASACCKHYVANEMENSTEAGVQWDRYHFDAKVGMQDLVDSYMPPFQACVEKGRVSGLMCSYNALNGVPACADKWLLQDVARDTWGFDGYITSDCHAENHVFDSHNYTKTPEESVRDILRAGTDSDCGPFMFDNAKSALEKGWITEADIDKRMYMLFRVRMRLSHFDPLGPLDKIPASEVCSEQAQALARQGSVQSATLLKNAGKTLPLDTKSTASALVVGPNYNQTWRQYTYYGPPTPCGGRFWNMADAVQQYVPKTAALMGVPAVDSDNVSAVAAAAAAAKEVDRVFLVLGTDLSLAREGLDASSLELPKGQEALARAVLAAARKPVVVLVLTATPLDISWLLADERVGAVMHLGQPGVQTLGVGDLLFGKSVPAGRLVQTVYPASYADEISIFDFNMRPGDSKWPRPDCPRSEWGRCKLGTNPGRTHRFYTGKPVLPFGFGLSYSSFRYKAVGAAGSVSLMPLVQQLSGQSLLGSVADGPAVEYFVEVANVGEVDADDVVLGFLVPPGAGKDGVPLQQLFGFERVHVPAGETRTVNLYPAWKEFSAVDAEGRRQALPGSYKVRFGLQWAGAEGMGFAEVGLDATLEERVIV